MKQILTLALAILLMAAAPTLDQIEVDSLYKEGQKLFADKHFEAALDRFLKVDEAAPDAAQVYSWIGASLNELGRYAEAKKRLEQAIELLEEARTRAVEERKPAPPVAVGYHTLLARIQTNLKEFDEAAETLDAYKIPPDGSAESTQAKQAIEAGRQALKAKIVLTGAECLQSGDLDCARRLFSQADSLSAEPRTVRPAIAREYLSHADKAPSTTEAEKTKRAGLYRTAVEAARLWIEEAGPGSAEAQRALAKSLAGTRTKEGYEEAVAILKALWEDPAQPEKDPSIQLELAVAHAGLEQWELSIASAKTFVGLEPDDALGQGYCLKSYGEYRLGECPQAVKDGELCKNADGSPRALEHLEVCRQRLADQAADKAARQLLEITRRCDHLYKRIAWARDFLQDLSLEDVVKLVRDYKASEIECVTHLEAAERKASGAPFASPMFALCGSGAKTASTPLNLSMRSRPEVEALEAQTKEFLSLCRGSLSASQIAAVESGLRKVEQAKR